MNDITLRCSQPWPGGILGRPVVPVHQPRLSHKWESNPTVHCFYFTKSVEQRLYCVPTVERATGVLSVEMCIFWKSKHLFPASDNFFLALFVSSAFHFKYASAERAADVLSVEKCILWKSKHLFPGFYSFSRAFCFQCFSFQLSQLFHQSSQLGFLCTITGHGHICKYWKIVIAKRLRTRSGCAFRSREDQSQRHLIGCHRGNL